ncbi:MAG: YggS family pyridoxal phosphate-dependent enzyme [Eubacteriales bacterium]
MEHITQNVAQLRQKINQAAIDAGRNPAEITFCAATKMNDTPAIRTASEAGIDCCGENRVQELQKKQPEGAYEGVPIHFIGHLQTNKVKFVVGNVDIIQSVDRLPLLEAIEKEAAKKDLVQTILLEVNIGQEESKGGFTVAETMEISSKITQFPHVKLVGLMAIPPISTFFGENSAFFQKMYQLFIDIRAKTYDNVTMECLSMGMSDDYVEAIANGSTMIRIGTAIFGARNY